MRSAARSRRGIALVMVAAALTALMGFAAIGVDLAFLMEAQGELSAAADATALASASGLQVSLDEDTKQAEARNRAVTYAELNKVLGESVNLNAQAAPLLFGRWDTDTRTFQEGELPTNAVRVSLELTEGSIPPAPSLFFAPVLGQGTGRLAASATAALVGSSDVGLALDRSSSMKEELPDTKRHASTFVDLLSNSEDGRVALAWYNSSVTDSRSLTEDFDAVQRAINDLNVTAERYTNIAAALCVLHNDLVANSTNDAVRVIVLLTDGRTNTQLEDESSCSAGKYILKDEKNPDGEFPPEDPRSNEYNPNNPAALDAKEQARRIAEAGMVLYTISLGNDTLQPLMIEMSQLSGGEHFHAPTTADLEHIFAQIAAKIPVALVE